MVWGDKPIDTTATAAFDRLDATMAFPALGDEDLTAMGPTQTLDGVPPARHQGSHRKQRRLIPRWVEELTARQTAGGVAAVGAVVFVAVLASAGHHSPGPASVRQAAPEAAVATPSPTVSPRAKRPAVRPVEPVARRHEDPAPVNPVHTVVVTITATPTATPTPKPTASSPKPTASPTPDPTSPDPVEISEPADPDENPTPDPEADRG